MPKIHTHTQGRETTGLLYLPGLDNKQINNLAAMQMLGLKKTTYYKLLKEYKSNIFKSMLEE